MEKYDEIFKEIVKLKEKNELLEAAIKLSNVGVYITDAEGTVIFLNQAHGRITGLAYENIIGKKTCDLERENGHISATTLAIEKKRPVQMEQTLSSGRSYFVYAEPSFDGEGALKYVISNLVDTTEINQIKQELAKTETDKKKLALKVLELRGRAQSELIYNSENMQKVIEISAKIAPFDSTVLIVGESGVGKELIADYIHQKSLRNSARFIKINCAAIPEHLLESELFGYEQGAFTGAGRCKRGILELANQGTVFLDEVGELPLTLQPKLLRFMQDGEIFRIGGEAPIKTDVRVLAATNRELEKMVEEGKFRSDFYYRLNVIRVSVPSLAERKEDIPPLIQYFVKRYNEKYGLKKEVSFDVIQYFINQKLSGNVRELQNILERILLLSQNDLITIREAVGIMEGHLEEKDRIDPRTTLKNLMEQYEKGLLEKYLAEYKTTEKMAEILAVSQPTISRKLQRYRVKLK